MKKHPHVCRVATGFIQLIYVYSGCYVFFLQSRTRYGLYSKIQSFDILPEIAHLPPHIFFAVTVDKGIPFGVPGYFSIEQSVALWQLQKVCGHIIYP